MEATEIDIPLENLTLKGNLSIPADARSFVIFSHGSGSSRFSSRNNFVARQLNDNQIATLLTDLLTEQEDRIYENRFNIDLLTKRLMAVTTYTRELAGLKNLRIGYFGASTGAASALQAAAFFGGEIRAVVSRGGRPDLAKRLSDVTAATLLIVGSLDEVVIGLNEQAYAQLRSEKDIVIVKGATHLFEEPGKLNEVAGLAADWFERYLVHPQETYAIHEST